ncbi:MAG: hypothetical protein ACFFB2_14340 [Promethearchaeota archaeon]
MITLTSFQRFELVLIPSSFLFSQILVFIFGFTIIGSETWIIMGIPVLVGLNISLPIGYIFQRKKKITNFKQLESIFRFLVLIGAGGLIPLLIAQYFELLSIYSIFSILSFILSLLGCTMTISCILLLWYSRTIKDPSE